MFILRAAAAALSPALLLPITAAPRGPRALSAAFPRARPPPGRRGGAAAGGGWGVFLRAAGRGPNPAAALGHPAGGARRWGTDEPLHDDRAGQALPRDA